MALTPYQQLQAEFHRLYALRSVTGMLRWDAATYMPRGSVEARGEQLAVLETECHAILTAPKISRLLERAAANADRLTDWQRANLRLMRREYDHAIAVPQALVSRLAKVTASAELCWRDARQTNQFASFAPHLDAVLQLVRDKAEFLGQALKLEPYDALVDGFSPGLNCAELDRMFTPLAQRLPTLIEEALATQHAQTVVPVDADIPSSLQRTVSETLMRALGFSFEYGRLDESEHPFTGGGEDDVRITTRFLARDVLSGLMAVVHETGHALYAQGLPSEWRYQPAGQDAGMAVHESQSLLLEMLVGRSRAFVDYLQRTLAPALQVNGAPWQADNMYRVLNKVERGLIRVDADELTYPAHIMLRYDLERELLSGELAVRDLPEAWRAGMETRLGVQPDTDAQGCLQDIHWSLGAFGYFPSYAVGALLAGQLMEALRTETPSLDSDIGQGNFKPMFAWLGENVHAQGATLDTLQLAEYATGRALHAAPWLRYVESKYLA